jgi:hypothetical protein
VEVLTDFADRAPFPVRILRSEVQLGVVLAFEQALAACAGEVILLCDQDDRWMPSKVERLAEALEPAGTTLAFSDATRIDGEGEPADGRLWAQLGFWHREQGSLVAAPPGPILRHAVVSGCTMAVRASVLDAALPFPAALGLLGNPMLHDRWLSLVAACSGRVAMVPEPLVAYRRHDRQVTGAGRTGWVADVRRQGARPIADVVARSAAELRQVEVLERRLPRVTPGVQAQLDDLRRYLEVRAGLDDRRHRRLAPILGQWAAGGYRCFGSGTVGAALDVIRRPHAPDHPRG